ncbi:MAG TPA: S9 family peptidase [Azospirillaceae bacterium]|nr:S9 family peptidase [Azospirillaceae bacterium]
MRLTLTASLLAATILAAATGPVQAAGGPPPVEAYASPAHVARPTISPDGTHIAFLSPIGGRQHLYITKMQPGPGDKPVIIPPRDAEFTSINWINETRLLVSVIATREVNGPTRRLPIRMSRLVGVDRDGSNLKVLLDRSRSDWVRLVATPVLQFVDREHVLVAYPTGDRQEPDVVRLNVYTGDYTRVANAVDGISEYIPDPTGLVRLAVTYNDKSQTATYLHRDQQGRMFRTLRKVEPLKDPAFDILGFGEDLNRPYVVSSHESDTAAVYQFDLASNQFGGKVAEAPGYDITGAVTKAGKVVGFSWTEDMPNIRWLDPEKQKLQERLDKAVPDSRELIIDQTANGQLTLVASFHPAEPVTYRIFNRDTREFTFLGDTRPEIPPEAVAVRQPVSYQARDGLKIPGYLTLPPGREGRNLPFVVLPHGGPFARDDQSFDVLSQFLASRGYAVLQPNFRGSTGFGQKFNEAGEREWGGKMQDDVTDGVQWAISQGIADPSRVCIVGWSYGGYAALMGAVKTPDLYKCAIATAPVTNLVRLYDELMWSGGKELNRGLFFGGDRDALKPVSPYHNAAAIKAPVLLIHGDMDVQAYVQHSRDMASALKDAGKPHEYVEIDGMDHSPRNTEEMVKVLTAWERFLKTHLGAGS